MTEEGEKPKASARSESKRRRQHAIYWSAYAILAIAIAVALVWLDRLELPQWVIYSLLIVAALLGVWFVEESPANPHRGFDKDPFRRNFFTVNRHMLRAWALRRRDVEWRETRAPDLPSHVVTTFKDLLGVHPEVTAEANGLLWVAGERDFHGWPDPPRFVVIGFDVQGKVRATDDLDAWPRRWLIPQSPLQGRYQA